MISLQPEEVRNNWPLLIKVTIFVHYKYIPLTIYDGFIKHSYFVFSLKFYKHKSRVSEMKHSTLDKEGSVILLQNK